MQFREKMYRNKHMYQIWEYNIVFYDDLAMININEDIWEKHAFLVRDFFTF